MGRWGCSGRILQLTPVIFCIASQDPLVFFNSVALPVHKVFQPASEIPAVEDLLDFKFFFAVDEFWQWQQRSVAAGDWI